MRHLPPVQREEYYRLKGMIAVKEKQIKQAIATATVPSKAQAQKAPALETVIIASTSLDIPKVEPVDPLSNESAQLLNSQNAQSVAQLTSVVNPLLPDIPIKADPDGITPPSIIEDRKPNIDDPLVNAPLLTQPMNPLQIKITNKPDDAATSSRHITINNNNTATENPPSDGPVLRISTTDQIEIKLEPDDTDMDKVIEERKFPLTEGCKINEKQTALTTATNDSVNIPAVVCKVEPGLDSTQQQIINNQTTINSDASTYVISISNKSAIVEPKIETDDATLRLNQNIKQSVQVNESPVITAQELNNQQSKMTVQQLSEKINADVKAGLDKFAALPDEQQQAELIKVEGVLVARR